jgi:hypothetical protein
MIADLHEPREVIGVAGQSIMVAGDQHVDLPTAEELDHLLESPARRSLHIGFERLGHDAHT